MARTDARWRDVLAALAEGVVIHDANGQFETCNAAAERVLGLTAAQMAGLETVDSQWRAFGEDGTTRAPGSSAVRALRTGQSQRGRFMGIEKPDGTLGEGSTFKVLLPAAAGPVRPLEERAERTVLAGSETILLVDDFAQLRQKIAESLRMLGYEVLEAGSAEEGLQQWEDHHTRIDMLFTDISLPGGLNGLQLADRLHRAKPALKVILSSGYGDEVLEEARVAAGMVYLHKPCDIERMARTMRECFGRR